MKLRRAITVFDSFWVFSCSLAAVIGLVWALVVPGAFYDPLRQIAAVVVPGLAAGAFVAAVVLSRRRWIGPILHVVAVAVTVLWVVTVPTVLYAFDVALYVASAPLSSAGRGIRLDADLTISGALNGQLKDFQFAGRVQKCQPLPGQVPPQFEINGVAAHLGRDLVEFSLDVLNYDGPGVYSVGPAGLRTQRVATIDFSHSIGPPSDNQNEDWVGTGGTVTLGADPLSGRFDVTFQPRATLRTPAGPIRLVGQWRCSAPSATAD